MTLRGPIYTLFCALLAIAANAAAADEEHHAHSDIRRTAEQFALAQAEAGSPGNIQVEAGELDRRLQLSRCEIPLEAFMPVGGRLAGRTTVGIRCDGAKPWSIYIPVTIALYQPVLVAARPLSRGAHLTADDLQLVEQDVSSLTTGYLTDPEEAEGKVLKRMVTAGTPLTPSIVQAPRLIRRGERVTLLAETGGLQVRVAGKALADGAVGERVRVQNLSSRRIVEGEVVSPGVVKISL